jgi:hypothetical protein
MSRWLTSNNLMSMGLLLLGMMLYGAYVLAGSPPFDWLAFATAFSLFAAGFLRVGFMFVADVLQYSQQGWNYEARAPRADMRIGRAATRRMSPRTIMRVGYPLFLLALGAAAAVTGLQVFGFADVFGLNE